MTTHSRRTTRALGAALLAAGVSLTACGGGSTTTSGSGHHDTGGASSSHDSGHDTGATTPTATTPAAASPAATPGASAPSGGAPATGPHNQADVTFAQQMVPHHEQAVQMSRLVLAAQGVDPQVAALARQIEAEQGPEITQLTGWLAGWGASPAPGHSGHSGATGSSSSSSHGSAQGGDSMAGMPGMMSDSDMARLGGARGPEATRLFLTGMITHHRGAVDMAREQLAAGSNPQAKALAKSIVTTQEREIAAMTALLQR